MADYLARTRSNPFRVKDTDRFALWLHDAAGDALKAIVHDDDQRLIHFEGFASIPSTNEEGEEISFFSELAEHLAEDEIAVVFEIGSELLRYLVGTATAVAPTGETTRLDLNEIYRHAQDEFMGLNPIRAAW